MIVYPPFPVSLVPSDPHRSNPNVHYRLYLHSSGPVVITVQDFDYPDYDDRRFLTGDSYTSEQDAEVALARLLTLVAHLGPLVSS